MGRAVTGRLGVPHRLIAQDNWAGRLMMATVRGLFDVLRRWTGFARSDDVEQMAMSFRALSDPLCLTLLTFLAAGDHTPGECAAYAAEPEWHIRRRLESLRHSGWVTVRPRGCRQHYELADPRTAELILLARELAADNCDALSACAHLAAAAASPAQPGRARPANHDPASADGGTSD